MHFKKFSLAIANTFTLLKQYNEFQRFRTDDIYRVIEIKRSSLQKVKLVIQVIGKSSIFECSPQDIVSRDSLLEGFSKKDIRNITYLACEQKNKPKYKILIYEFCDKFNRMIFKLKNKKNETIVVKTASQIVMDKNIISNLSSEDINSISYIAGYESHQNIIK